MDFRLHDIRPPSKRPRAEPAFVLLRITKAKPTILVVAQILR